jgi:16S rRNA (cytidine1402-2'-O)-methyltransferase
MPLFVVCTPIGNLEDLSQRAVRVLREAEVIAAEDTRAAQHLLAHSGAGGARLVSFFEGNEARRTEELVRDLLDGKRVALISEAGTPGVSDPGERLVAAAVAAGVRVEVIPGPSAAITALVGSGLPAGRFLFVGFPPRSLRGERGTLIFYESPQRLGAALADLAGALGEGRRACVARELTKIHEEYVHDTLGGLAARYAEEPPRGECTVVVAGASEEEAAAASSMDVEAAVRTFLAQGVSAKEIAARLALVTGKPKRQIYQLALALSRSDGDNDDDGA